jgi:hypothetical protein
LPALLGCSLLLSAGSTPLAQEAASTPVPGEDPVLAPEPSAGERVSADNNISFPVDI